MGLFSRLGDIINANLNAMLDRAEDPEKIIQLIIQEMEDTLVEVRSAAVKSIAEKKELTRSLARLERERDDWQSKAELAMSKDREDLAKGALMARRRLDQEIEHLFAQQSQIEEALAAQNEDIGKLQAKLDDAKARRKALATRAETAGHRLRMREKLHDDRLSDAFARFEAVERKLDQMEGRVDAYDLGRDGQRGESLHEAFAALEADTGLDDELAALRAKVAGRRPAGSSTPRDSGGETA